MFTLELKKPTFDVSKIAFNIHWKIVDSIEYTDDENKIYYYLSIDQDMKTITNDWFVKICWYGSEYEGVDINAVTGEKLTWSTFTEIQDFSSNLIIKDIDWNKFPVQRVFWDVNSAM